MAGPERGGFIPRAVDKGVEITKPFDIGFIAAGVILSSNPLLVGGVIGLLGGEILKDNFGSKSKK